MGFFNKASQSSAGKFYEKPIPSFSGPDTATISGDNNGSNVNVGTFTPLTDPFGRGRTTFSFNGDLPPGWTFNSINGSITMQSILGGLNAEFVVYRFSVTASEIVPNYNQTRTVTRKYSISLTTAWINRQVITQVYMAGGYQNSAVWSNVNRTTASTDTTVNLGDGTIDNFHYKSGACGYTKLYVWNNTTTAFNMRTEVKQNSGQSVASANSGTAFEPNREFAWCNGEGAGQVRKWTFSTETVANLGNGWNDHAASISGEFRGIWWGQSAQTARTIFATDAWAYMGYSAGAHGQQKGLMAKTGFGYGGNQGNYNGGYQFRKTNIETETGAGTFSKLHANYGEENFGMAQTAGYLLGQYNGAQNNASFKYTYATDSGFTGGATLEPKGHGGCSSGHCGWRD